MLARGEPTFASMAAIPATKFPASPGRRGLIGPRLDGVSQRYYIAGELPNTPGNLMLWIEHPRQVEPHTAMPEMGVTKQDSRDIAAYLYTLR